MYSDGSRGAIDARALIGAPEAALPILGLAVLGVALAVLLAQWL